MKIGIIGAGYVGSLLAKSLSHHSVTLASRTKPHTAHLDIYDTKAFYSFCEHLDVLIITMTPDKLLPPLPKIAHIIYTSSTSVYQNQGQVDENSPLNGSILAQVERQFPPAALIFRVAGIYGPGREIKNRLKPVMPGNGNEPTNSIHVEDVVNAIIFGIERQLSGVFNLCNDDHITRRELYDSIAKQYNLQLPQFDPNLPLAHGGYKIVSNHKIKQIGYRFAKPSIDDGMKSFRSD